ncbi:MAG: 23S rRNA (guanosine(2251)-2'-O)-methyltransferase RlmB [Gammaproteobacteria bacterium]|nr:23S rRNA (guanosine(2251)-2'-O)-methyltransferase RlmB [Gammaproteobacteria bacterium]MCY4199969.1 23S rRNA (guanosine(2251)-2'-O)-methyltransferase RlmB [Gammaproteobacteria bacterium]MCY4323019.1 23S rRNA (guanosine(2251)-2'-O)-methyltransferase RlmB [Gammaproteobacteria bacterium]
MKRIVYGVHAVRAVMSGGRKVNTLHILQSMKLRPEFEALAATVGASVRLQEREALDALAGSRHHQGIIAEVTDAAERRAFNEQWLRSKFESPRPSSLILALDGIEDPRNFGACIRTAAAAGVDALIFPRSRGTRLTPAAEKAASGGAEQVPIIAVSNLARRLNWFASQGLQIIGADSDASTPWHHARFDAPTVLVVGSEGRGLRQLTKSACDALVSLPVTGGMASLNVSVATGVLLYEVLRQRQCVR